MVSTDDPEIADIAIKYGAKVPFFRTEKTSNDFATTFDVIEEVLLNYKGLEKKYDIVCCLYACAPFVTSSNLTESLKMLETNNYDSVFPVIPFGFPIQRSLKFEDDKIKFFYPEFSLSRSQDLEKSYHDAGQFYWMQVDKCSEQKKILTENSGSIVISELEGQDIDNEVDWKLAELKYELLQSIK
jgi:N-acylneuraminate cytidylyltransferase